MKVILWIILLLVSSQTILAQQKDSTFKKKAVTKLDMETFFSYYTQEGTHSAVTGGTGDEHLYVYQLGGNIRYGINATTIIFDASVDIITSPSTDKIDHFKSSASEHDNHVQSQMGFEYKIKNTGISFGTTYRLGIESDYLSTGISAWMNMVGKKKDRSLGLSLDMFFDDLRWGRLSPLVGNKPSKLIYPFEIRNIQWFDVYHRNSYNLNLNLRRDINKRLAMSLSVGATYQEGLLSTPFHRIYFYDATNVSVENLPRHRIRLPLSIGANWFLHKNIVLQSYYRIYWDNFGIFANTVNLQLALKPNNKVSFYPFVRAYYQTASPYFAPYNQHSITETFFTSDYDYSAFAVIKGGLGFGWYPDARLGKKSKTYFDRLMLRYSFFYRTDGLSAHVISFSVAIKK